jgi:hypothetical protein
VHIKIAEESLINKSDALINKCDVVVRIKMVGHKISTAFSLIFTLNGSKEITKVR